MLLSKPTTPQWAGLVLVWLGGVAALRWIFRWDVLAMAIPGFREMGLVAPLMLLSAGTACWILGKDRNGELRPSLQWVVAACAGALTAFPALMLFEHLSGIPLGVDFQHTDVLPTAVNPHPGRMSPNACIGFFAASGVLWLIQGRHTRVRARVAASLIAGVALVGGVGCIGYFLQLERLYTLGAANRLTLPVAYGLVLFSLALWLLRERWKGEEATRSAGHEKRIGQRSVVVLASVAVAAGVGGFAVIQQFFEQSQSDGLLLTATSNAGALTHNLEESARFPRTVASRPTVSQSLERLNVVPSDAPTVKLLRQEGLSFLTAGIRGVRFLNASGAEVVTAGTLLPAGSEAALELAAPLSGSRLVWREGFYLRSNDPVVEQGKEVGRVITEQPLPLFDQLTANIRQASATTDVLVCSRVGDAASCAPSRFNPAPFKIPMFDANGKPTLPINRALVGQEGATVTKDLRGTPVVAAYTPLERTGLALVVKTDVATIYAPLREHVNALALLLVVVVGAGWLALRNQVRPLVAQMAAEQRRTQVILENSNDAFIAIGADGRITDWNAQARRTFGWSVEEAIGQRLSDFIIPADQRAAHEAGFARFMQSGTGPVMNHRLEVAALHKHGHTFMAELSVAAFFEHNGYVAHAFMRDITERLAAQKKIMDSERHLEQLCRVDPLTGLSNRRNFEERLEQAMARTRRNKRPMALVFIDVDYFKQINDVHGHAAGDAVLKEFAARLQGAIRVTDMAARLGGDEFVVLIEGLNTADEASIVSEKLQSAIRAPMAVDAQLLQVTASMGLAYYEGHGSSAEALVAKADQALYRAKAAGRDTFVATII